MESSKPRRGRRCPPGCQCGRHTWGTLTGMTPEQKRAHYAEYQQRRRTDKPGENAEIVQRWRERNPEKARERNRGSKAAQYREKYLYGLTPETRAELVARQDGCCYLCGEPLLLEVPGMVHVDHDHSCCRGARSCGTCIRGLACEPCNKGIGLFGDDPERMRRVADNLEMATRSLRTQPAVITEQEQEQR